MTLLQANIYKAFGFKIETKISSKLSRLLTI